MFNSRERRRLKKLRKDKLRQLSSNDDANAKHKHKHKHKCGLSDELCKHRKHKKRRKHKKHHHRETNTGIESNLKDETVGETERCVEQQDNDSVEAEEVPNVAESRDESKKSPVTTNSLTKSVNIKLNKIEWPIDEDLVSSVTEDSSGSSYVRTTTFFNPKIICSIRIAHANDFVSIFYRTRKRARPLRKRVKLRPSCRRANCGHGREKVLNEPPGRVLATRKSFTKQFNAAKKRFRYVNRNNNNKNDLCVVNIWIFFSLDWRQCRIFVDQFGSTVHWAN